MHVRKETAEQLRKLLYLGWLIEEHFSPEVDLKVDIAKEKDNFGVIGTHEE